MAVTVLNWYDADRRTVVADEAMAIGDVVKVVTNADGQRHITKLGDTDDALALSGNIGIVFKVAGTADSVQESTAAAATGDRTVSIASGDLVTLVRKAIVEYNADELHASLDPDNSGTLPAVGADLGVSGSKFSTIAAATSAGIASPVIARCYMLNGTKVAVELVL